jgi:hypothetical protein
MNSSYTILSEPLHGIADLAISYFVKRRGVPRASIVVEKAVDGDLPYRPTFTGRTTDHYILCVDVGKSAYSNSLDEFVLNCISTATPVKLYVAISKGTSDPDYSKKLNAARRYGVGVLEVDSRSTQVIQEALPLSLAGVRPIVAEDFPACLRESLTKAETMFRGGAPDKACSIIFDEIEIISRNLAKKTYAAGCWNLTAPLKFNFDTGSWATLMDLLRDHLDLKKAKCPSCTRAFLARIHGVTPHRNDSGHKPKNREDLRKRDRELRTRFEAAVDLLGDLIAVVKPLHIV